MIGNSEGIAGKPSALVSRGTRLDFGHEQTALIDSRQINDRSSEEGQGAHEAHGSGAKNNPQTLHLPHK
jgi:hypothetical protein